MDAILQARAEQLATEFANQHPTADALNALIRLMMKTVLERMLNTELDVHLGRRAAERGLGRQGKPGGSLRHEAWERRKPG
jgi:transposase-like protein